MTVEDGIPDFVGGDSGRIMVPANTDYERDIPADCKYIVTASTNSSGVASHMTDFKFYELNFYGILKLSEDVTQLNEDVSQLDSKMDAMVDVENIEPSTLQVVNAGIESTGIWRPTQTGRMGRSIIIDTHGGDLQISVTCPVANTISFLKSLPSSFSSQVYADFADGETGRRNMYVGENTFAIPAGTNYIAAFCENSAGTSMMPSAISITKFNGFNDAVKCAKNLVSVHGQEISDGTIYLENMANVVPISDPLNALASGECNVYHEVATGLVYVTCIEGFDHPYEAYDVFSLYVFSLTNPNKVKRYVIATKLDNTRKCGVGGIILLSYKKVRIFYTIQDENSNDGGYLYYRDFNFSNETLTDPAKVKLTDTTDLTAAKVLDFTTTNGGVDTGKHFVYLQKITDVATDGYRYGIMSCGESISFKPVVVRSNDNFLTCEFITLTSFNIRYDCAIGVLSSKLYFVFRVAGDEYASTSGTALCTADISNGSIINWSTPVKFAEGDSRPDCYTYNNKVYMMAGNYHSVSGKPMRVSSSVWEGTSSDPADYTKVLVVSDTRGVQNPRVFRYGAGDYGVLMGNSPARVDYANGYTGQWQFKTAVCFVCSRIN